jgi:hypothetical protein
VDNWKNIANSQNSVRKKSFRGTFSFSIKKRNLIIRVFLYLVGYVIGEKTKGLAIKPHSKSKSHKSVYQPINSLCKAKLADNAPKKVDPFVSNSFLKKSK